ncbi:MAG: hypothetical protein HZA28_09125 [Candidatus Omnitrophica bacterium]|nr:hypothetical protein [Candidatus Omnitrophota bacterium]
MLDLRRWMYGKKRTTSVNHLPFTINHKPSAKGQVAVILILVVAAALIFYAVSLNLGRISQTKVVTTIAAETGASQMASYMASMGESIFRTTLGGHTKVCGWTGFAAAVVAFVIVVVAVALSVWTGGGSLTLLQAAAVVLALAAVVVQAAVIEPGVTKSWGAIVWHALETRDAFVEQGVQTALSGAVTDGVQVTDMHDSDGDRVWGLDINNQPLDRVSRFGYYYRQMRLNTIPLPVTSDIQYFLDNLRNFLTDDGDNWGIYDKTGPNCDPFGTNSECNPCCVPDTVLDADGNPVDVRPVECGDDAAVLPGCTANSPYGADYPWVYDPYRENPNNAFFSFREQLGRDDEHRDYRKNPIDNLADPTDGPNGIQASMPGDGFRLEDTTAYHAADNRRGVFGFFYKIADWKVGLAGPFDLIDKPHQCHWCDRDEPTVGGCPADQPAEAPQLVLPAGSPPSGAVFNTTLCVDGTNPVSGNPPLAVDLVRLPDPDIIPFVGNPNIGKIEAVPEPQCAQNSRDNPDMGFWKRGGDRFCSSGDAWPYYGECSKYDYGSCTQTVDGETIDPGCACAESGSVNNASNNWPDDLMDDLVYGLNGFIEWATKFLAEATDVVAFSKEFKNWYPEASQWIEPGAIDSGATVNGPTYCYMCDPKDGALWVWLKDIQEIRNRLKAWRDTSFASAPGSCREVWCVPPAGGCPGVPDPPAPEEATFDSNDTNGDGIPDGNGIRGDMEDIAACVNWNANDTLNFSDGTTATGNDQKFQACLDGCAAGGDIAFEKCADLPRSLVPGVNTSIPNQSDLQTIQGCLSSCTNSVCQSMNPVYFSSDPATFDFQADPATCTSGIWYNEMRAALAGFCDPPWLDGIQKSIPEAANQVVKFRQRYNYLSGRLNEMNNVIMVLDEAERKFDGFLTCTDADGVGGPDGAACKLIKARIDEDKKEKGLPYQAIYGWQSEPEAGQPAGSGKWHLVRADARLPEKCDNDCNPNQIPGSTTIDGDPRWPWVRTYKKSWGMKRCYELEGTDGMVKVRVSRFDETGTFSTLLFPNAVEIWKPTFERGDRPLLADPGTIGATCAASIAPGGYYDGAFILNKRLDGVRDPACVDGCATDPDPAACIDARCPVVNNAACWDLANKLLASGVTSEACAQYYFHGGMEFKFVRCPAF